jgi:hypothetical protein
MYGVVVNVFTFLVLVAIAGLLIEAVGKAI